MITVSAIIPAYNRAGVIKRAIDSVREQTFKDIEIIVIDDGSTDNTAEIVQAIADPRIRYIRCESNRGPGTARNEGLKAAKGQYIAFLDSDDEWLPQKIEKQVTLMESLSEDWGLCHTGARIVKDGEVEKIFCPDINKKGSVLRWFINGKLPCLTPTVMIRKTAVNTVGLFDELLWRGQDFEYLLRAHSIFKMAVIPECLAVVYMDRNKQLAEKVEPARLRILEKQETTVREKLGWRYAKLFRGDIFGAIATAHFDSGSSLAGLKWLLRGIVTYPFRSLKYWCVMTLKAMRSFAR